MHRLGGIARAFVAIVAFAALLVWAGAARASYAPPKLQGSHVVDLAGKLSSAEAAAIDRKLTGIDQRTTNEIAVFLPASLEGNSIEDVAYYTFQSWKLGKKDKDNGVLLVVAPAERKIYITTGKGVGDRLTDLQTKEISKAIGRHLKEGHFYAGIDEGTSLIASALGDPAAPPTATYDAKRAQPKRNGPPAIVVAVVVIVILLIVVSIARRGGGGGGGGGPPIIFFGGGGGGDGGWGGGGSDDSGGGGGFSGGGGETGGGGAGSDY